MSEEHSINHDWLEELVEIRAQVEPDIRDSWKWISLKHELVAARKRAGLTQEDMAERLQVSQARIARIEKHPELVSMDGILRYLAAAGSTLRIVSQDETKRKAS